MKKILLIFMLFLSYLSATNIDIDKSSNIDILGSSEIFIDYSKKLTIDKIIENKVSFSKIDSSTKKFGYSPDFKVWIKFTLHNIENEAILKIIEFDNPLVTNINFYENNNLKESEGLLNKSIENSNTAIIFMSAYCDDETLDKAAKIEPFAYLVKPFNRNDLKSSMNIATYKLQKRSEKIDENGKYKLSHEYYYFLEPYLKVYFKNQEIDLTKNERLFLEILIKAKGEVVRFSEIENFIWFDKQISDSTLRTLMHRTTSKFNHKIIKSVSSIGYKINFS
ncbi:winged helix-turn-helix domain-containing protein [Aliarcobacter cryaerophilus]|uniref:7TM-DISM domain-containing protein n=1 Tax=Aliarcobacter cryaerophilus TaxID=28198 RepID=UPI003DA32B05